MGVAAAGGFLDNFGGLTNWPQPSVAAMQRYDPASNAWTELPPMPLPRAAMGVAVLNGKIYAAGGLRGGNAVSDFAVYDPATGNWTTLPSMPTPRDHLAGAAVNGKFYAVGGRPGGGAIRSPVPTVEMFDPVANAWSAAAPMATARGGHSAGVLDGRIHVFGGEGGPGCAVIGSSEAYDRASNSWAPLASMPTARHGMGGALIAGSLTCPERRRLVISQRPLTTASPMLSLEVRVHDRPRRLDFGATAGSGAVSLAWNASAGTTGYDVYPGTGATGTTTGTPLNGATLLTATSFVDATAVPGMHDAYVVTAVNARGALPATARASAEITSGAGALRRSWSRAARW